MSDPSLSPRRYLVTGGHGYVGSWIVRRLAEAGHAVFTLSRGREPASFARPPAARIAPRHISADLVRLTAEELAALLPENLDGCVHTASFNESAAPGYARKALEANAWATRNLLDALVLRGLPLFIYFSTFHVYGASGGDITEDTPPAPANDYALTHLFGEEYCRMAGRLHGLPFVILRLTNGYGAPLTRPFGKWYLLLNDLCRQAVTEGAVSLRSNPSVRRDFVWLGDVAAVVQKLLLRPDLAGSLFNLAREETLSIGEVASLAAKAASRILGKEVPVRLERSPAPVPALRVDSSRLRAALGYGFSGDMAGEMENILAFLREYGTE